MPGSDAERSWQLQEHTPLQRTASGLSSMMTQEQLVAETFDNLFPGGVSEIRPIPVHRVRFSVWLSAPCCSQTLQIASDSAAH